MTVEVAIWDERQKNVYNGRMRKIIVVSGLGDSKRELGLGSAWWKNEGLRPFIFLPNWGNGKGVKPKLVRLLKMIDKESGKETIFLMGISAGASLAMNAFLQRLDRVEKMVSLCGRLRFGYSPDKIRRKMQKETLAYRAFRESVKLLESNVKNLEKKDRKRVLTVSAKFGDELIPIETSRLEGAKNILIPTAEHILSIFGGMTVHFKPIREFLLGKQGGSKIY